jgi:hypothetical protein
VKSKQWKDMSGAGRAAMMLIRLVQLVLVILTIRDIHRRPPEAIRGNKKLWYGLALSSAQVGYMAIPIGPIAYLLFGHKSPEAVEEGA